jgi:hypothetical protein
MGTTIKIAECSLKISWMTSIPGLNTLFQNPSDALYRKMRFPLSRTSTCQCKHFKVPEIYKCLLPSALKILKMV